MRTSPAHPARDAAALESALERILYDDAFIAEARANVARVREQFYWERTLAPLVEAVRRAEHAADWTGSRADLARANRSARRTSGLGHDLRMAWHHLVNSGPSAVTSRIRARLTRSR